MACSLAITALLLAPTARAQPAGEQINSYDVGITIEPTGSILVVERFAYKFGSTPHHGVFRDIPVRAPFSERFDRVYPLDVMSVAASGGASAKYKLEKMGSTLRIRIGDPNRTVTGLHIYTVTYSVRGALNHFSDHDELYWNAIGPYWEVPTQQASVRVAAPGPIGSVSCFAGPSGSGLPCARNRVASDTATFVQPGGLGPGEGITVVVGFRTGLVPTPRPILAEKWSFARAFDLTPVTGSVAVALTVLLLLGLGRLFWVVGRDRRSAGSPVDIAYGSAPDGGGEQHVPLFELSTYPVEYAPPDEIKPGQMGTLIDEMAHPLDVTATVVDLAVRGYLRIEEIPKQGWFAKPDWWLVKLKAGQGLLPYERRLFDGLFDSAPGGVFGPLTFIPDRPDESGDTTSLEELARVRLSTLRQHFVTRLKEVQTALYEDAASRGWFAGRPDQVRQQWHARGFFLLNMGAGLTWLAAAKTHLGLIPVPLALAGLALAWGSRWMPRRTPKGTGLVRRIFGFRTYIETAESQEARFQEKENLFSRYLPYAIVFGCTEKWAKAFRGLADEERPVFVPWYVGSGPFSINGLTSSLDHFALSTTGSIASAASGSSGFGGGGVGGGGGGGGGGSW
jgi:Predicted membrane protein (DUF2207)